MFPQTELDNYKLQVELLQEKLKRSEEHRKQLEEKFESIIKKRSEEEKITRSKKRIQYHKFLDEQRERNERNKALVKLLERVDQQAAVLSARSERLKMMKHQYELYFSKLLQAQSMRSLQNSPARFPILAMNNVATSQPTITVDGMYQTPQNIVRGPTLLQENWNPMVLNPNIHNNQMYQIPAQMDYMHGQIILSQPSNMPRQVNFKQSVEEPMSPAYSTQSSTYTEHRRAPTEYERFKLNELSPYEDISIRNYARTEEQSRDPRESQGLGRKGSILGFNNDSSSTPRKEINRVHYEKDKSDKIPHERSDQEKQKSPHKTPEKRKQQVVDDDYDDYEEEQTHVTVTKDEVKKATPDLYGNKPQPRTVKLIDTKIDYSPRPEPTTEQPRERPKDLSFGERFLRDVNRLNNEKVRAPVMWNFGGRIEPTNDSKYPIQLGKKEKLSIENIENAIYGELINPITRKKEEMLEKPETPNRYEREIMPVVPLISEEKVEMKQENDEKSDTSEKEEKVLQQSLPLPAITTPVESKPSTPVSEITPVIYSNESEKTTIHSPQLQEQPAKQVYEIPNSNQEYPKGYPPNYEERYYNEQPAQQEQQPTQSQENLENTTALYPNYDYPQQNNQSGINYPAQQEQEYPQGQDNAQNVYQSNQYQNPDYQYAGQPDYSQGNEYADFQGTEYQGDYSQQGYDPSAYQYQYDQQADGNYQDPNQPPYEYDPQAYPDQTYAQDYTGSEYANYDTTAAIDGGQPPIEDFSQPYQSEAQPPSIIPEPASTSPADLSTIKPPPPENKEEPKMTEIPKPKQDEPKEEPPSAAIQPTSGKPASILSTEKSGDANKKKKKVNFLDSESEESSSAPRADAAKTATNDESDFEFSSGSK